MRVPFTPAPWGLRRHLPGTIEGDADGFRYTTQDAWYIHDSKHSSSFLADVFLRKPERHPKESQANVTLMVAAPELYNALADVLPLVILTAAMTAPGEKCPDPALHKRLANAIGSIHAAMLKAEVTQ